MTIEPESAAVQAALTAAAPEPAGACSSAPGACGLACNGVMRMVIGPWSNEEAARAAAIFARERRYGTRRRALQIIAAALKRSYASVNTRFYTCGLHFVAERVIGRPMGAKSWTQAEVAIAAYLWQRHISNLFDEDVIPRGAKMRVYALIAKQIDHSIDSVQKRYCSHGPSFVNAKVLARANGDNESWRAPPELVAERDYRLTLDPSSLTAALMGDPLPGYSALDRRR